MRKLPALILVIAATLTCVTAGAGKRKVTTEGLLTVITPVHKGVANAHPWINVRVRFGQASDESEADRGTFKAWIGSCRIPDDVFEDVVEDGQIVEKRVRLTSDTTRCRLKKGNRLKNRLKFKVRASGTTRKQLRLKDTDKVRFGMTEDDNHLPELDLSIDAEVIRPNTEVSFSAAASHDPDGDWLTYEWDFGDPAGTNATGETVTHTYTESLPATVTLTASDGDESATATKIIPALPALGDGRTAGSLALSNPSENTLDFGAVSVGQSDTRTFTVHNSDPPEDTTSQVKFTVQALGGGGAFTVECPPTEEACELGPGEQREITVTFAPTVEGEHAEVVLQLLATASDWSRVELFAHGYGDGIEGTGKMPWGMAHTAYYLASLSRLFATGPDGTVTEIDTGTGSCESGSYFGAPCIVDGDCHGATCGDRTCIGGPSNGSTCNDASDCPSGTCGYSFDPIYICADGTGSVFLLNDDIHDDPNLDRDPQRTGTILRVGLDGNSSVVTDVVAEQSLVMACDGTANGRLYWAQYDIYGEDWDDRENLMSIGKDGTSIRTHVTNISQRLGDVDPENYIDPDDGYVSYEESTGLRVSADGKTRYVVNSYGLYRLDPTPLVITQNYWDEQFDLFPDGSILAADVTEDSTRSTIRVYKIDPNNAINGPVHLDDLTPWATMQIPNNRGSCSSEACSRTAQIMSLAVDSDGIVFASVLLRPGLLGAVVPTDLRLRGTARFEPVADGTSGTYTGFVNLEALEQISF